MDKYTVTPCAKINLGLNITEKRPDGYHNLETVFYPVPIYDTISITRTDAPDGTCSLELDGTNIQGSQEDNLVVKAYRKLSELRTLPGTQIILHKNIPTQAGMGGGSADCAYTLSALNTMFDLGITDEELIKIAAEVGADCPFFIKSEPVYATGIGEIMSPIDISLDKYWLAIVKPPVCVSTREAFSGITPKFPKNNCKNIVSGMQVEEWRNVLTNDFESTIFPLHPELAAIKEGLYGAGAIYAAMSGSGSALFGIFSEKPLLEFKGCRVESMRLAGAMELFPIVDESGNTIGKTTRSFAHGGMKPLHPVVHLHVFNSKGELFLQKRPAWKDIQPGKWDTAVGGHVDFGENTIDALKREALEELGLSGFQPEKMTNYIFESDAEREFVNSFRTTIDSPLLPSATELDDGKFFSREEIRRNIGKDFFTPNFESEWIKLFG